MKIFLQILFVWQENDLVFSSEFEKKVLQKKKIKIKKIKTIKIAPFSKHTHTTQNKIQHDKVSTSEPRGKGTQIFYKTIKSCVIVDFIVED